MAAITITPGVAFEEDDFWIASGALSVNERFVGQTGSTGGLALGLGNFTGNYREFQFQSGDLTYRYIGDWHLVASGSLLTTTTSARGTYDEVIVERAGVQVARLETDAALAVNFGSATGLDLLGLGSLLSPVLGLLFSADGDRSFANLHLSVTPTLPDLAGIDDGDIIPGDGDDTGGTTGPDVLVGTPGNDTISGLEGNDSITGLGGDDVLFGNQGNDTIDGGPGNDSIYGGQNDDVMTGGTGNDYMVGGFGRDLIRGNAGDEVIFGGNEAGDPLDDADTIYGGQGNDVIYGNGGGDLIYGGDGPGDQTDGNDTVYGGMGNDTVYGNAGDDYILGQRGSDVLYGDQGNDFLHGGQENDTVDGGQGNDTIWGGLGDDVLIGGSGSDLFVFAAGHGRDVVKDFSFAQGDRLDLQGQTYTTAAVSGGVALQLADGGSIVLEGIGVDEFSATFAI